MNKSRKTSDLLILLPIFLCEISVLIALQWMLSSETSLKIGNWQINEWLINYEVGFVRRGLSGQIIHFLAGGHSSILVLNSLLAGFLLMYSILFFSIYFLAKIQNPKILLLGILIPGGIFQMGLTMQFFVRKEILFLILFSFLCILYLMSLKFSDKEQIQKRIVLTLFGVAIVGGILMTLIHEGYCLMAYPLTVYFLWIVRQDYKQLKSLKWMHYAYILIVPEVFLLCTRYHGDPQLAQEMWLTLSLEDRLLLSPAAPYSVFGPMASLGWGMRENFLTIYGVFATGGWKYWLMFIFGNFFTLILMSRLLTTQNASQNLGIFRASLIGLVLSSAMFVIAADWGRWIAFLSQSLIIFTFTISQSKTVHDFPSSSWLSRMFRLSACLLFTMPLLWAYGILMKLPECCINPDYLLIPYSKFF